MNQFDFTPRFFIGEKIKFIGCSKEQINWGNNDNPNNILVIGNIYEISEIDVHSSHTKLSLSGIIGKFNSVCFDSL